VNISNIRLQTNGFREVVSTFRLAAAGNAKRATPGGAI
jgi:hypothetical protein